MSHDARPVLVPPHGGFAALAAALALMASLGVALALDVAYFRNGVSVAWRTEVAGETVVVARTVEHEIRFVNDHRALARYVQNWRVGEHGVPTRIPHLDAMVSARLFVPGSGYRHLGVRTNDEATLFVDGDAVTDDYAEVRGGWHRVDVHWTGRLRPETSLALVWGGNQLVERQDLLPVGTDWPSSRVALWLWALGLGALAAALAARAARQRTPALRREHALALLTLAIVVWGTGLRAWDYDVEPEFRDNYDEYFNMWNGWSLLEDGSTRGWSAYPGAYRGSDVSIDRFDYWGVPLVVNEPYFENLPLMHVLVGAACHLGGATDYRDCHMADGRVVTIALSALTILLIVLVGRRLSPIGPAPWLGALLWASIPSIVLQTRVIKEEMVVGVIALASLLFFLRWRDDGRRARDLDVAAVLAGLAVMAKIPAGFLIPALVMLVASTKGGTEPATRAASVAIVTALVVLLPFIAWQGPLVFLQAQNAQVASRGVDFMLFPRFFYLMMINGQPFGRGWALFLWVAAIGGLSSWSPDRRAAVAVPALLYLVVIGVASGNYWFGWYALPLYALLVLPAGAFLAELWRAPDLVKGTLFGALFVMYSLHFLFDPSVFGAVASSPSVRRLIGLSVIGLVAPYALVQVWPRLAPAARAAFVVALALTLVAQASLVVGWESMGPTHRTVEEDFFL